MKCSNLIIAINKKMKKSTPENGVPRTGICPVIQGLHRRRRSKGSSPCASLRSAPGAIPTYRDTMDEKKHSGNGVTRTGICPVIQGLHGRRRSKGSSPCASLCSAPGAIPTYRDTMDEKKHSRKWSAFFHGDPYGNRTHVTAVKGPCLNRLTNGPFMVADVGFEPTTCRV